MSEQRHPDRNAQIVALYRHGWTASEIANHIGCTRNTVAGALHRAGERRGLVRRKTGCGASDQPTRRNAKNLLLDARDLEDLRMLRCWDDGWSTGEIAAHMRVSRNTVIGRLDRIFKAADPGDIARPWGEENLRLQPTSF